MNHVHELRELLRAYLTSLERLRPYGIESLSDYAEYAFEQALQGKRVARGKKGHDVLLPRLGRVQVKERRLPADGRLEERLHLRNCSSEGCDFIGAVIFANDYTVKKATLVPFAEVERMILTHPDREKKVRFDLIAALPSAVDLTERLQRLLD